MIGTGDRFRQVHVGALALALIMLPWSEFLLSNAQFLLVGCWLWDGVAKRDFLGVERLGGRVNKIARKAGRRGLTNARVLCLETGYTLGWGAPY